jgi:hypothetical protein
MKKILIFIIVLFTISVVNAQKRLDVGFIIGTKRENPYYEDNGGQILRRQSNRLVVGGYATYRFHKRWAWDFGIGSNNTGIDFGYLPFRIFFINQGITMIQIPNRISFKFFETGLLRRKQNKVSLEAVLGMSYIYNWNINSPSDIDGSLGSSFSYEYEFLGLKRHIFWLDYGLKANLKLGRFNFFATQLWQNAFTPIVITRGKYTINGQSSDFSITSHGRARNFLVGVQYSFNLNDKEERAIRHENRKFRRENRLAIPDSLRNLTQFSKRAKWALVVSSQAYLARNTSQPDSMRMRVGTAPGLVVGFDYSHQFNARWALAVGLRAGVQHYAYRYDIPARSAGLPQDFRNSSSAENGIVQVPISVNYRYAISARKFYNFGVGVHTTFNFLQEEAVFVRPIDAENPVVSVNFDYTRSPSPNVSPYLSVGYGKMLAKGNVLKWDLIYNAGLVKTFAGSYQIRQFDSNQLVGQGTFFGRDSFVGIQMSYIFNSLRRQIRKDLL